MKNPINRRKFVRTITAGATAVYASTARSYAAIPGANEKFRLGLIGCGSIGRAHWRTQLGMKESDNIDLVAVCDVYKKRVEEAEAAAQTGATSYANYKDILERKDIDGVVIATPDHWHHQMALDALDAGKHVYLEKPMTHTIREAQELVRKVKDSGLKLQVGVQGMSDESYEVANQYIRQGTLGKVVMAQIDYSRNFADDFFAGQIDPDAKPGVNLDWKAWLGPAPQRPWDPQRFFGWHRFRDYSGGVGTNLFTHRIMRMIKALGLTFPDHVTAMGGTWNFTESISENPETFNIMCNYPGGPTLVLISSMANDTAIKHVIRGHEATLEFTRDGFVITPQEKIVRGPRRGASSEDERKAKEVRTLVYYKKGGERIDLHLRNLLNAVRHNEALRCDAQHGYYAVVATMMGLQSYREKAYLKWNREKERVERA